jgi:hypothetical protein
MSKYLWIISKTDICEKSTKIIIVAALVMGYLSIYCKNKIAV